MRAGDLPQRLAAHAFRLASVVAGGLILKHEVYDTQSAEITVIALGLWLIGVPPALWLDTLRKTSNVLIPDPEQEPQPPARGKKDSDVPPQGTPPPKDDVSR